jgi:hypothetical protein
MYNFKTFNRIESIYKHTSYQYYKQITLTCFLFGVAAVIATTDSITTPAYQTEKIENNPIYEAVDDVLPRAAIPYRAKEKKVPVYKSAPVESAYTPIHYPKQNRANTYNKPTTVNEVYNQTL